MIGLIKKFLSPFLSILFLSYSIPVSAQINKPIIDYTEFSSLIPLNNKLPKILLDDDNWDAGFREGKSIDGGEVYAMATSGDDIYIAGSFGKVGNISVQNIARWNTKTQSWFSLGEGIEGLVTGIAVHDNLVFVAGIFTKAGNVSVSNVAVWDTQTQHWSSLNNGIPGGIVKCVCITGNDVYFGGFFTTTFGIGLAHWNIDLKQWIPMVGGLDGPVISLAATNTELFIGGSFHKAGNINVSHNVRYNFMTNTWRPMLIDLNGAVTCMVIAGDSLYMGGKFFSNANSSISSVHAVIWDIAKEKGVSFENISQYAVISLTVNSNEIYIAEFNSLQKLDRSTNTWTIDANETIGTVYCLTSLKNKVFLGGKFGAVNKSPAGSIAEHTVGKVGWTEVGGGVAHGLVYVQALAVSGDNVFVGGSFTKAGGKIVNNIVSWNTQTKEWIPLSGGINGRVFALSTKGNDLYVGGDFTYADTVEASRLARWNSIDKRWYPLGKGIYGSVHALAFSGDKLYVGGAFTRANDSLLSNIAVYNTASSEWSSVGDGITGGSYPIITALVADDSNNVYIGGKFTKAGDSTMNNITRWNEKSRKWNDLGGGVTPFQNELPVGSVSLSGKSVYVGGTFDKVGNALKARNIAEWNTDKSSWNSIGDISNDSTARVSSIVASNGRVYIGGSFNNAEGTKVKNIAVLDSNTIVWSGFGSGAISYYNTATLNIYGLIFALASGDLSALQQTQTLTTTDVNAITVQTDATSATIFAGGLFTETGGKESRHFGIYVDSLKPSSPLNENISVFPNPSDSKISFRFDILSPSSASLSIFDITGREITSLFDQTTKRGRYTVDWNSDLPSGVYIARLKTPSSIHSEKLIITR